MGATDKLGQDHEPHGWDLAPGSMLRVQRARGWTVHCERGGLLLTQEGDARDFVLRAGDHVRIDTQGRVLVEAFAAQATAAGVRLARIGSADPGRPVVRVLARRRAAAGVAPMRHTAPATPGHRLGVAGQRHLLETLTARARRERHALLAACAAAAVGSAGRAAAWAVRHAGAALRIAAGVIAGLRPQLPSLQETFAAVVFLRSRL